MEIPKWDPTGQGRELIGFGLLANAVGKASSTPKKDIPFGRIDRFDPARIWLKGILKVEEFSIKDNTLIGWVTEDGKKRRLEPKDWRGVRFDGRLACPNPRLVGQELAVTIEITDDPVQIDPEHPGGATPAAEVLVAPPVTTAGAMTVYGYRFKVLGHKRALCEHRDDVAVPIPGHWEHDLHYNRASTLFSFVCLRKNLAKCIFRGHYSTNAPPPDSPDWLEACAHMMTADYCGDGQSFTHNDTQIRAWDTMHPEQPDPKLEWEGAWDEHGIVCLNKPRWKLDEWQNNGSFTPCLEKTPGCPTYDAAMGQFPGKPLIFTQHAVQRR